MASIGPSWLMWWYKRAQERKTKQEQVSTLLGPEDIVQSDSRMVVHEGLPLLGSSLGGLLQLFTLLYLVSPHEGLQSDLGALNQHAPPHRVLLLQCTVYLLQCTCLRHRAGLFGYGQSITVLHVGFGDTHTSPYPRPRAPSLKGQTRGSTQNSITKHGQWLRVSFGGLHATTSTHSHVHRWRFWDADLTLGSSTVNHKLSSNSRALVGNPVSQRFKRNPEVLNHLSASLTAAVRHEVRA